MATIKQKLKDIVGKYAEGCNFDILTPPDEKLGDYSTNLAFSLSKNLGQSPMHWAEELKQKLAADNDLKELCEIPEIVPPGFVNFRLTHNLLNKNLEDVLSEGENYGDLKLDAGQKINLEFVSANPTGPLTMGNARSASFGDTLGNIFRKAGLEVVKEYYINDAGVQVVKLGQSLLKRFKELKGEKIEFEEGEYQGEYLIQIAKKMLIEAEEGRIILPNPPAGGEKELVEFCKDYAIKELVESAKQSVANLDVNFDVWFFENQLHQSGEVNEAIKYLEEKDYIYEKDGAKWFKVSLFDAGQEDAVVVKSDGSTSYLMNDIAYTKNKLAKREFNKAINVWGADHYGDVPRLKAGAEAMGFKKERLEILLHQHVLLKEDGQLRRMSKREGRFVLLDDLIAEVGKDAIRFFFMTKDLNTHIEFDIGLAKEQSKKNPVFYIQYAFARLNSIFDKAGVVADEVTYDSAAEKYLKEDEEIKILCDLIRFPDLIESISRDYQVHHLAQYALDLATDFHKFYEIHRIIQEDKNIQTSRLVLAKGVYVVLKSCLSLMGLSAPEKM